MDNENKREIRDAAGGVARVVTVHDGGVTGEQVKAWKGEYRKVHVIEVEDDGELFVGYFRRPSMETLSAVTRLSKADEVKGSGVLFDNCWLGGSPVMKSDAVVYLAALRQLGAMLEGTVSALKNA
ncbi:MAG: hypothetical protein LBP56_07655 [Odoribacteraceae bacterium]|jgi:hypothetical protein|nr:hypothetical protein [Odoribacteraceae bacterium]